MGELPSLSQPDSLFGPHDVATTADGDMIIALGALGSERELGRYGQVLHATEDGNWSTRAEFLAYEQERNPDDPYVGSNPYSVVVSDVGEVVVADAAINGLFRVGEDGSLDMVVELEPRMAELPPAMREAGDPEEVPMDTVPTGLAIGPDDAIYVSNAAAARSAGEVVRIDLVE